MFEAHNPDVDQPVEAPPPIPPVTDEVLAADEESAWPSAPMEVLSYVLRTSAATSQASADRSRGKVLEVAQIFGDTVLTVRHIPRGRAVRLGGGVDALEVPLEALPSPGHALFEPAGSGWVCAIDPAWGGFVETAGERRTFAQLLSIGEAQRGVDGLLRVPVGEDQRVVVDLGTVIFVAQAVYPSRRTLPPAIGEVDPAILGTTAFMGFVAVLLGVALWTVPAPPAVSTNRLDSDAIDLLLTHQPPKPVAAKRDLPSEAPAAAKKPEGAMRSLEPPRQLTKKERDLAEASVAGILGAMENDAELASALNDAALPGQISTGINGLVGARSTQNGPGLGQRGGGLGGGGTAGTIGDIGTHGGRPGGGSYGSPDMIRSIPVSIQTPKDGIIVGALDKALVDAVIKRNMQQIRYCYQRELTKNPSLSGKVAVRFVIAGDGSVSSAVTKTTTMGNPAVESCINARFMRFEFPKPKGGGIVIVSYPFLFSPG